VVFVRAGASQYKKTGSSISVACLKQLAHFAGKIIGGRMTVAELKDGNSPSAVKPGSDATGANRLRCNGRTRRFARSRWVGSGGVRELFGTTRPEKGDNRQAQKEANRQDQPQGKSSEEIWKTHQQ